MREKLKPLTIFAVIMLVVTVFAGYMTSDYQMEKNRETMRELSDGPRS